jgi:serine/threonine protein kinase
MAENIYQQLGNYRILNRLGGGGYADVYLGEHIYLKTQAAIKVLRTHISGEDVETFRNEAFTIAHLSHPHIVRLLDFAVENHVPFLIMEYAPHGNLRQRHPKGTHLPPETFLPYVQQIASALQYAHNQGLIHRDVKPENMLIGRDNQILLSDFGTALVAQSTHSQSTEDTVIGTLAYMAPEQLQGKPRPASDQYALAIVVYEWLSGSKPFNGSYMEIVAQHLSAPPPDLAIPQAVQQVLQRALAKDPHQRFPRVQDFADALQRAYQAQQQNSLQPSPSTTTLPSPQAQQPPLILQSPQPTTNRPAPIMPVQQRQAQVPTPASTPRPAAPTLSTLPPLDKPVKTIKQGLKLGARLLIIVVLILGLLLCGLGYFAFHLFTSNGSSTSTGSNTAGSSALANDFVQAISNRNYDQAYNDLGPPATSQSTRPQFIQQVQSEDKCYGAVTEYKSAGTTSQGNSITYYYTITRAKLQNPYQLHLTLQRNSSGNWQITSYDSNVTSPACP